MEVQKRLYTVDDVLELQGWDGTRDRKYELINGELIEMSPANLLHFWLASELTGEIRDYLKHCNIGIVGVEGGFSPPDEIITTFAYAPMSLLFAKIGCLTADSADLRWLHAGPRSGNRLA